MKIISLLILFFIGAAVPGVWPQDTGVPEAEQKLRELQIKNAYLLGHIAWDKALYDWEQDVKQRKRNINPSQYFSDVKSYYQNAIELNPFYPEEQNGIISHLADIRLTNVLYMREGDYEQAINRFDIMVEMWPEDDYSYLTYYFYGKALESYGDVKREQLQQIEKQIQQIGNTPQLLNQKEQLKQEMQRLYQRAITEYGKAIEVRPHSQYVDIDSEEYLVEIVFHRGFSAFKQGNFMGDTSLEDAEHLLKEALDNYRDHPVAKKNFVAKAIERLGDLYVEKGLYDKAVDQYLTYIDNGYEDEQARVRMKLANTYKQRFSFQQARTWYQKIINENPPPTPYDIQRAKRDKKPIHRGPTYEAYKNMAETYLTEAVTSSEQNREDMLRKALQTYQTFASKYPNDIDNYNPESGEPFIPADVESQRKIGNIYYELEDYPEAAKNLLAFIENNPHTPYKGQIYNKIGKAYIRAEMLDEAINKLYLITEKDIQEPAQYADVKISLARAYEIKAGQFQAEGNEVQYKLRIKDAIRTYQEVLSTGVEDKVNLAEEKIRALSSELNTKEDQRVSALGG